MMVISHRLNSIDSTFAFRLALTVHDLFEYWIVEEYSMVTYIEVNDDQD